MKRLAREIAIQRDDIEAALIDILANPSDEFVEQSATLAEAVLGEHDPNYRMLRTHIEAVLKQAFVEDIDPIEKLIELCDK